MFRRTATDLGLDQVLNIVSKYSMSSLGAKAVTSAIPVFDRDVYIRRQKMVEQVIEAQIQAQTNDLVQESFPDISSAFEFMLSNPTGSIEGYSIYDIGLFINSAIEMRTLFNFNECLNSLIKDIILPIDDELIFLKDEIFRILESPGQVRENYPTVKALREKAEFKRIERSKYANQLMHECNTVINGDTAVLRDGRIVLPVKNDCRSKIEGYVQGSSQSGGTVFMEPFRLVDINNAVILAVQEIDIEIARLLGHLSMLVRRSENKLRQLSSQVKEADFLYSFASWIRANSCVKVLENKDFSCNLIKARHPLLKDRCVPIDLTIPSNMKAVVLTGPNAGGKTVTMKTVGLFSLINQICGYIPASDGSSLALFDRVFTDIGDDQSIENHLSTFSGHIKSVSFILKSLTDNSLVILDELGSGTDPQEGAALARSILEFCTSKALLTLTTSHHGVLKQYAYSSDIVLNASMEFSEKTLAPTFRVINGLPGESHAIDTAVRMRLPYTVTENAKLYMGKEAVKISSIIKGLEQKRREADEMESEIRLRLEQTAKAQKNLEQKQRQVEELENKLKKNQFREFDDFVSDARKQLEGLVKELREGEITREKTKKIKEQILRFEKKRNLLKEEIDEREAQLDQQNYEELIKSAENVELRPGMDVLCGQYRREGTVIRNEGKGRWQVAIGPMKFVFKETDLAIPNRELSKKSYIFEQGSKAPQPKLNLDLRGYRLLEALEAIDNEIEACCVHGIKSFSVIHGYGDGILSTGIHKHLSLNKLVESCAFANPDDGGQGKTYVTLK